MINNISRIKARIEEIKANIQNINNVVNEDFKKEFKTEINKDDNQSKVSEVISTVKEWKDGDEGAIDELISRLSPDKFKNKNSLDFYKAISDSLFK
ncbi:MAG: hypothetical protein WC002_03010 [Candidatus Muiribacteriota bacterium]